jgi:hypothetical protein
MVRRNSSAADDASAIPLASSSLAAATRSSIFCWRSPVLGRGATLRLPKWGWRGGGPGSGPTGCPAATRVARADVFMRDFGGLPARPGARSKVSVIRPGSAGGAVCNRPRLTPAERPCAARCILVGFLRIGWPCLYSLQRWKVRPRGRTPGKLRVIRHSTQATSSGPDALAQYRSIEGATNDRGR